MGSVDMKEVAQGIHYGGACERHGYCPGCWQGLGPCARLTPCWGTPPSRQACWHSAWPQQVSRVRPMQYGCKYARTCDAGPADEKSDVKSKPSTDEQYHIFAVDWERDTITSGWPVEGLQACVAAHSPSTLPRARSLALPAAALAVRIDGEKRKAFEEWWTAAPGAAHPAPFDQPFSLIL